MANIVTSNDESAQWPGGAGVTVAATEEPQRECAEEHGAARNTSDGSSFTFYLKEVRGIPLLPHAQEIALSKQREEGEAQSRNHVLSSPPALQYVLDLGERVSSGELLIDDVIEPGAEQTFADDQPETAERQRRNRDHFLQRIAQLRRRARHSKTPAHRGASGSGGDQSQIAANRTATFKLLCDLPIGRVHLVRISDQLKDARRARRPGEYALEQLAFGAVRKQLLSILDARQETALRYRFGIEMDREHTLRRLAICFLSRASAPARSKRKPCGACA